MYRWNTWLINVLENLTFQIVLCLDEGGIPEVEAEAVAEAHGMLCSHSCIKWLCLTSIKHFQSIVEEKSDNYSVKHCQSMPSFFWTMVMLSLHTLVGDLNWAVTVFFFTIFFDIYTLLNVVFNSLFQTSKKPITIAKSPTKPISIAISQPPTIGFSKEIRIQESPQLPLQIQI